MDRHFLENRVTRRQIIQGGCAFAILIAVDPLVRLSRVEAHSLLERRTVASETLRMLGEEGVGWHSDYPNSKYPRKLVHRIGEWKGDFLYTVDGKLRLSSAEDCEVSPGSIIQWWQIEKGKYALRYSFRV